MSAEIYLHWKFIFHIQQKLDSECDSVLCDEIFVFS